MHRLRGKAAWIALWLVVGAAGCHLTGGLPVSLSEGHGRVDRTFSTSLGQSVRAAIVALDDLKVHPIDLSIRGMEAVSNLGKPGWASQTNAEYFPDDQSFHDLFDRHRMNVTDSDPVFFNPVLVTYKGETEDGRAVSVIVRAEPPDASKTLVMTRVGRGGDEAWSRNLLDRMNERLSESARLTPVAPTVAK